MSKLIIIRGPVAAGKTTVSKALMKLVVRPTVLISRDHYMFMFKADDTINVPDKELIENDILFCLKRGFDVIFEGNFKLTTHEPMLKRLFKAHPNENYIFYMDVSLAETLKRHGTRSEQIISEEKMKELYGYATPMRHTAEIIIPEDSSPKETIRLIQEASGI